jgi:hypothetical protein
MRSVRATHKEGLDFFFRLLYGEGMNITKQHVSDTLACCFEGGSNYWVESVSCAEWPSDDNCEWASDVPSFGGVLSIKHSAVTGDDEYQTSTLTMAGIRRGIKDGADYCGRSLKRFIDEQDAGTADVALQLALFNEVVFG